MTAKRGPGRPPVSEPDELRSRALEVLYRRGYQGTTMGALADEVGVSVRTLHRYFPTKADIVWGGIEGAIDALAHGFATADESLPITDAITAVVLDVFDQDADALAVGRARMRLIATTPELRETRPETYRRWREQTIEFVARRLEASPSDIVPRAVGAAVQAAIDEALAWWAAGDRDASPAQAVAEALRGFDVIRTSGVDAPAR